MCGGGGGFDIFGPTKVVLDPTGLLGVNKQAPAGLLNPFGSPPKELPRLKPPKGLDINTEAAAVAQQHQKDLFAVAFGLQDTQLTGATGLGSVPKSLLLPKATLGG